MGNVRGLFAALIAAVVLSACGGGVNIPGPSPAPAPAPAPSVASNSSALVHVAIFIPRALNATADRSRSPRRLRPQSVPAGVGSIAFTQTQAGGTIVSGTPVVTALSANSPNCSSVSGGATCNLTLVGALGDDSWSVAVYASLDGSGRPLSVATLIKTVLAGAANVSNLTLNPVVARLVFVPTGGASCNAASACIRAVSITALDPNDAQIVGPGNFVNAAGTQTPITITPPTNVTLLQNDGVTAANLTLSAPGTANLAELSYNGLSTNGAFTIGAAAGSNAGCFTLTLTAGSLVAPSVVSIGNTDPQTATISISESGYGGTFTVSNNTCAGIATISAPTPIGTGSATFSATQVGGGPCSIVVNDNHGGQASISILSTTYQVTIS